jgi:glycosyltransferase involved in cell wall biosynthesis
VITRARPVIVIPCFNEARRLEVDTFRFFLQQPATADLCFVDDGSTDATLGMLQTLAAAAPDRVQVLRQVRNGGKGEAVRAGLQHAAAEGYAVAAYLDADLAAPLDAALGLFDLLGDRPELAMAIGSRVKLLGWRITRSERRHYLGRVFATFASITLGLPIYDTQCGAKAIRLVPEVIAQLNTPFLSRWLFDVELIARLRDAVGAERMREVPLAVWEDPGGSSLRWTDFLKAPLELWRIRRRYPAK